MVRRVILPAACGLLLLAAGCGGDEEAKTVTRTVTAPTAPSSDREAIVAATRAYLGADDAITNPDVLDLRVVKTNGRFADVSIAGEAHAILKKSGESWVVLFDGNGPIPPATIERFGIPPEYSGQ